MSHPCSHDHDHSEPSAPGASASLPPRRPLRTALRFLGWTVGFSGLYSMTAVCPFCGRPGCPVGGASAGMVGLVFAALSQWGGQAKAWVWRLVRRTA